LPHLQRYSVAAQRRREEEEEASASSDDGSDEDADAIATRPAVVGGRCFRRSERPKPFTLLPLSELRPEMVLYTFTEVETLCRAYSRAARKARAWVPPEMEKVDFVSGLFDLTAIKEKAGVTADGDQKWRVTAFRTNGVEVCLTFISGHVEQAPNVSALLEAKYNIPFPSEPIDVRTQTRGLFCATQSRNDLAPCSDASGLRIAAVDPGFVKPVAVSVLAEGRRLISATASRRRCSLHAGSLGRSGTSAARCARRSASHLVPSSSHSPSPRRQFDAPGHSLWR
jgi:hypothetical protein